MPHDVQVQKVVLLPRFTSFWGGNMNYFTAPINIRSFASATVMVWTGVGVGSQPSFYLQIEESSDLENWDAITSITPTPESESVQNIVFGREWMRLAVAMSGSYPGFTCWAVGDFVTRAARS